MKKHIILALVWTLAATGGFALNVGGGVLYDYCHSEWEYNSQTINVFGLYGFVGWKYVDIDLGVAFWKWEWERRKAGVEEEDALLRVGLSFKVPIKLSRSFRFYPIIGGHWDFGKPYGLNGGGPHGGLGADIILYKNIYLHCAGLYNYNLDDFGGGFLLKFGLGMML